MLAAEVLHRVNAGGPLLTGTPDWEVDTLADPAAYHNGGNPYSSTTAVDVSDPSIPADVPAALFQSERWDPAAGAEMQWNFPVTAGMHEVRLYFAEIYPGAQTGNWPAT